MIDVVASGWRDPPREFDEVANAATLGSRAAGPTTARRCGSLYPVLDASRGARSSEKKHHVDLADFYCSSNDEVLSNPGSGRADSANRPDPQPSRDKGAFHDYWEAEWRLSGKPAEWRHESEVDALEQDAAHAANQRAGLARHVAYAAPVAPSRTLKRHNVAVARPARHTTNPV